MTEPDPTEPDRTEPDRTESDRTESDPAGSTPVDLHFTEHGPADGPTVLLSGSLGSNLDMWDPQAEPLAAAGFRVVRLDHRGHGKSPVPPGPYRLADLAGDATALLDRLGVRRAHWVGLSLGGMVGMWLAAHRPDRVATLALCCTSTAPGPPEGWLDRAATVRAEGTVAIADAAVARWFTPGWRAANPDRTAHHRAMIAATPAEGYASCCTAIATMRLTGVLPRITAPTLVLSGAEDPATPPDHGERIARAVPGAALEVVPGAAHLGNVEQPGRFTAALLHHLEGNP
ncbi:3-oxoadipate enol-lactonase [Saccharothrix syringae]|uniref:3-oxoadipate enol-lactonase n=1 Tax=Saccharothrix syringae TaxID=103733 RepID=A0A5Q0GZY7_SACSY|nr:3-oxoadipate enol-lactonase [Saccharothrix syringae]QFZ19536.1 3-oxoadipate enol-lactonase [Saccharothrix syringae]